MLGRRQYKPAWLLISFHGHRATPLFSTLGILEKVALSVLPTFNPTQWTQDPRYAYPCPLTIWVRRWGWPLGQALVSMAGRDHPLHLPTDGPVGQAGGQVHHGPHRGSHLPEVRRAIFCSVRTSSCCSWGCQELPKRAKWGPYVSNTAGVFADIYENLNVFIVG